MSHGWIKFTGHIKSATYSAEDDSPEDRQERSAKKIFGGDGLYVGRGILDTSLNDATSIFCLNICIFENQGYAFGVLIIESTGDVRGQYRRIGAGYIRPANWFDGCPQAEVTLI